MQILVLVTQNLVLVMRVLVMLMQILVPQILVLQILDTADSCDVDSCDATFLCITGSGDVVFAAIQMTPIATTDMPASALASVDCLNAGFTGAAAGSDS